MKNNNKAKEQKNKVASANDSSQDDVDYKDKYLRSLADYQNLLKRTEKEKLDGIAFANQVFVQKLIPVLDHIERAQEQVEDEGIALIYKELNRVLTDIGVSSIEINADDKFNPEYMECIEAEEGGNRIEIIRTGYVYKGKVMRPVLVKVVK